MFLHLARGHAELGEYLRLIGLGVARGRKLGELNHLRLRFEES
jgi:hypothetical protein